MDFIRTLDFSQFPFSTNSFTNFPSETLIRHKKLLRKVRENIQTFKGIQSSKAKTHKKECLCVYGQKLCVERGQWSYALFALLFATLPISECAPIFVILCNFCELFWILCVFFPQISPEILAILVISQVFSVQMGPDFESFASMINLLFMLDSCGFLWMVDSAIQAIFGRIFLLISDDSWEIS